MQPSKSLDDHAGSSPRKKDNSDRELRNSGQRKLNSSTQSFTVDPHTFNAYEAAKYLNECWAAINEHEPQAAHKETEKAWGTAKSGACSAASPFLVTSSTEFLTELQRAYAKLSAN
jgi:hypothetical protein